ncbi:hypothetical protein A176_003220 [Myxococcus hansupus]|uniref:Uncharacterized protein n=1 Tax=Pseudomyxococcus hansupus TaxID=1297742 RepID=A0A0H4WXF5_9BACT|nr:hypothetical protein A176_003220 [Myxococcus hansupus]
MRRYAGLRVELLMLGYGASCCAAARGDLLTLGYGAGS